MNDSVTILLTAWLALGVAAISPGPNMVAVASRGLGSGRQSALMVALGISVGGLLWAILTSLGLGALFQSFPILLKLLGILGGGYLAWLGFKGWRAALQGSSGEIAPKDSKGALQDFRNGFLVTATNPKVALLWASLSTFTSSATGSISMLVLFASISSLVLFTIYGFYGLLFSIGGVRQVYERFQRASDAAFGSIFCAIGLALIWRSI